MPNIAVLAPMPSASVDDHREREARVSAQPADRVAHIAHDLLEHAHAARVARLFLHAIHAAERESRAARGFRRGPPAALSFSASRSRWKRSSSSSSRSTSARRNRRAQAKAHVARDIHEHVPGAHCMSRTRRTATVRRRHAFGLGLELVAARARELVELRAPIVVRLAPLAP